ncbi:methylenetetrahydrofolate--tRNA-(uracil(54)-C(5))-methyltransferase (FADH(2)-oxidizing) TrmFO [bacterium 3DAC]|nr:methylenetetrahydrofolate--tRNA-(uracil(54)-C(5))-methyltransferase (FADH(2)-oxidizing) TrmFO [bacterium 3DAC]
MNSVIVIGAGLAGSEAALTLASLGVSVKLYEMRPWKMTPAHRTDKPAELVCSNSLGSRRVDKPKGLLLWEALTAGASLPRLALSASVPAGGALAVDRQIFSDLVGKAIQEHPMIEIVRQEVSSFDTDRYTIVAAGPLLSDNLSNYLSSLLGTDFLHFYDAISPTVVADTIDMEYAFWANRYDDSDGGDYLNIPLTEEEYYQFVEDILAARKYVHHDFEEIEKFFDRCLPIEEIARRGKLALAYGPMRPVGLVDPRTGKRPFAVIQLRKENKEGTLLNMVGFQTGISHTDQVKIFRKIPALRHAEFARLGQIHRNTFINAPKVLGDSMSLRCCPKVYVAGQLSGTEGYLEAIMGGFWSALSIFFDMHGIKLPELPKFSMWGGIQRYLHDETVREFQPMGSNFGLLPLPDKKMKKKQRRQWQVKRAIDAWLQYRQQIEKMKMEVSK